MRRLGTLLLFIAGNLGIWTLVAVYAASEFRHRSIIMGGEVPWNEQIEVQLCTALLWAALTPLLLLLGRCLPFRAPHRVRNVLIIAVLIPLLAVLRAAFGGLVVNLAEHQPMSNGMISLSIGIRTHRDIAILAAFFFVYNLVDMQRESMQRERQRLHAQTLLARAEMDELRTRLQPRFAVRMLRHIAAAIRDEPARADGLIVALSAILRRSMARHTDERVVLSDELEHLDRCLDLCRAGGRVAVEAHYVAADDVLACRVPAHVLEPVIESAVLDLTSGSGGSVSVTCNRAGGETYIDVSVSASEVRQTTLRVPCEEAGA
jgi:Histidine kinase